MHRSHPYLHRIYISLSLISIRLYISLMALSVISICLSISLDALPLISIYLCIALIPICIEYIHIYIYIIPISHLYPYIYLSHGSICLSISLDALPLISSHLYLSVHRSHPYLHRIYIYISSLSLISIRLSISLDALPLISLGLGKPKNRTSRRRDTKNPPRALGMADMAVFSLFFTSSLTQQTKVSSSPCNRREREGDKMEGKMVNERIVPKNA